MSTVTLFTREDYGSAYQVLGTVLGLRSHGMLKLGLVVPKRNLSIPARR